MSACQDYEELLTLHAAGALEPDEEPRVRAHLESCAACRSEAESTARVLAEAALPPPSPALREKLEALPQRTLGAWRREQVHRALRARTMGALLAAAAVVLLMLAPSFLRPEAPRGVPLPAAAAVPSEGLAAFEQWASADPLTELLDPADAEDDAEDWEEYAEADLPVSELFLYPNPGDFL
jgi:anti-sigma factor RsiW